MKAIALNSTKLHDSDRILRPKCAHFHHHLAGFPGHPFFGWLHENRPHVTPQVERKPLTFALTLRQMLIVRAYPGRVGNQGETSVRPYPCLIFESYLEFLPLPR